MRHEEPSEQLATDTTADSGYGRARLCVGISAVGTWVLIATAGLTFGGPRWFADAWSGRIGGGVGGETSALLMFVVVYAAVQLPFDLMGGYLLPRAYGRSVPSPGSYLLALVRGVTVNGAVLFAVAGGLTAAGHYGGLPGFFVAAVGWSLVLLAIRGGLARALATIVPAATSLPTRAKVEPPTRLVDVADEGFTGGLLGVARPRLSVLPAAWGPAVGDAGLRLAVARRTAAVNSGSWSRGRILALGFTWAGLAVSALAVGLTGNATVGTAAGTVAFSLWFTLWSFLGLLILPTFSRRGVAEVDTRLLAEGATRDELNAVARTLDRRQDGEPTRPGLGRNHFPSHSQRAKPSSRHG